MGTATLEVELQGIEFRVAEGLQRVADLQRFIDTLERLKIDASSVQQLLAPVEHQLGLEMARRAELERVLLHRHVATPVA